MSTALLDLKRRAEQLEVDERAELALALIRSLDGPLDADVEDAWKREIERRVLQIERGEVELVPGNDVFRRLRQAAG